MDLHVKSDGSSGGTRVETEDGTVLPVTRIAWKIDGPYNSVAKLTVEVPLVPIDAVGATGGTLSARLPDLPGVKAWRLYLGDAAEPFVEVKVEEGE